MNSAHVESVLLGLRALTIQPSFESYENTIKTTVDSREGRRFYEDKNRRRGVGD